MEIIGHVTAVSLGVAARIGSKWHIAFLYSSHPTFSPCILLASMGCIHTVVQLREELTGSLFVKLLAILLFPLQLAHFEEAKNHLNKNMTVGKNTKVEVFIFICFIICF